MSTDTEFRKRISMKKYCEKWKSVYQNLTAVQCEALLTFSFMAVTAQVVPS